MRVGLVIYGSLDTISGGYLYDRKLVDYLQDQGDKVEIISMPWRDYAHHLSYNFSSKYYHQLLNLPVDVLLQDELNHPSLFWLNRRLRAARGKPPEERRIPERRITPIISIVHHLRCSEDHPTWQNLFYRWIERLYLSSVDGFIFNSRTTRQVVENLVGIARKAVIAYPAGDQLNPQITDLEIKQRTYQPGPLRLLFVGNIIPRKGLHRLIEAVSQLPKELWELTVIGGLEVDRAYVESIQDELTSRSLTDRVHLLGATSQNTLHRQMQSHHVMAVPSSFEGFGIIYLEGMGFGLPAIASTGGAAKEIITDGEDGYLIEPDDFHTLAQVILQLSKNRERLMEMSLVARNRYLTSNTWEQTGEQIREFLLNLEER